MNYKKYKKTQILNLADIFYKKLIPPDHIFIKIILCPEKDQILNNYGQIIIFARCLFYNDPHLKEVI